MAWYDRLLPKLGVIVESLNRKGKTIEFSYPSLVIAMGGSATANGLAIDRRFMVFGPGIYEFRSTSTTAIIGYATVESTKIRIV